MSEVRVRFAPSPTGGLHMGGVRTALYNYLFAKQNGGKFLLRIEDTDQNRYIEGAEEYIIEALKWSGLEPDEGVGFGGEFAPYRQSERKEIYKEYVLELIKNKKAYYAFDTPEELDKLRNQAESKGEVFNYNALNRYQLNNSLRKDKKETEEWISSGKPYVVRFMIPENEVILLDDIIRGKISINSNTLDDKVLFKSDGMPTYHLANIVDDHLMKISHVIRGEEWLPSLPLHVLLYEAFGWESPKFAHLPLILKPEGKGKLSKRDGEKHGFPIFPLEWKTEEGSVSGYREEGYFPEAFINMLALLGWNPGTEDEIFSLEELTQLFDLNKVSKSGARFNPDKAVWFNHQYLQKKTNQDLLVCYQKKLIENGIEPKNDFDLKVIELLKERANFVKDIFEQGKFFYLALESYDEKAVKKAWKEDSKDILNDFSLQLSDLENFSHEAIHDLVQSYVSEKEIGFGKLMMPMRLSLVGALQGPDIPVIMELLGKDEVLKRIKNMISILG